MATVSYGFIVDVTLTSLEPPSKKAMLVYQGFYFSTFLPIEAAIFAGALEIFEFRCR